MPLRSTDAKLLALFCEVLRAKGSKASEIGCIHHIGQEIDFLETFFADIHSANSQSPRKFRAPVSRLVACAMAGSRDWMFCPLTGALLDIDPQKGTASCKASRFSCRISGEYMGCKYSSSHVQ